MQAPLIVNLKLSRTLVQFQHPLGWSTKLTLRINMIILALHEYEFLPTSKSPQRLII